MGVLCVMGVDHSSGWGTFAGLGSGALFALSAPVLAEALFRGYLIKLLSAAAGTWIAVLPTSTLFGAAHAAIPVRHFSVLSPLVLKRGLFWRVPTR
jgi:membrane protease YdiL (CAAX protease family)